MPRRRLPGRSSGWMAKVMILGGILLMILAVTGVLLQNWAQPAEETGEVVQDEYSGPLRVGKRMANFTLPDLNGNMVQLSDYSGHMVLINAWATWCPPCRSEMPDLNALYQKHRSSGFVILAINAGETRDQAAGFAKQLELTFPILLDQDESLMDSLGIRDYPTSILVDGNGVIKALHVGLFTQVALDREIEPLIK